MATRIKFNNWIFKYFDFRKLSKKYSNVILVNSTSEVPDDAKSDIYLVGIDGYYKWVMFSCPDGCGIRVEVNLMKVRKPFWHMQLKRGKITIRPSIIVENCGAHFWLEKNTCVWSLYE